METVLEGGLELDLRILLLCASMSMATPLGGCTKKTEPANKPLPQEQKQDETETSTENQYEETELPKTESEKVTEPEAVPQIQEKDEEPEEMQEVSEKPQETATDEKPAEAPVQAPNMPTQNSAAVCYNDRKSWWFKRNKTNTPPSAQQEININQYGGYYLGDTSQKVIYLTFDEGYENGYTSQILDVLKDKGVKAAFFVTKSYIESEPELVRRMVAEGHIVGNHSVSHPDFTAISDEEIAAELEGCAAAFEETTGYVMPPYFRPPEGVYSIRTLEKTWAEGYKTIFWSYAYQDWDVNNQPGKDGAFQMVKDNYHNGSIMLLHAVSQSNTEALPEIIDFLWEQGYTFKTLDDLP